jgi:hypothetical protein
MYKSYNIKNDFKKWKKWNEMIQNAYLKGVGYYKHHHYHYPYTIQTMVFPFISVANLRKLELKQQNVSTKHDTKVQ